MIHEHFASGNSHIHRIDPRSRVLFAVIASFVVALSNRVPALLAALTLSLLLTTFARLNLRALAKRLVAVLGFLVLVWILLPMTYGGDTLFHIGPLPFSHSGLLLAARISLKTISILLVFTSLVATMPISTLGHCLDKLHVPEKLVYLLLLTYRYIFVIEQEYRRLRRAAAIRGFAPKPDLHTYRTFAYLAGMLFVRASARAERVHQAMMLRGFNGKFHSLHSFSTTRQDRVWTALMGSAIIILATLEWMPPIR